MWDENNPSPKRDRPQRSKRSLDICIEDCLGLIDELQSEGKNIFTDNNSSNTENSLNSSESLTTFNLSSFQMTPDDLIAHLKYQKLLRLPPRSSSLTNMPKSRHEPSTAESIYVNKYC